MPEGGQRMAGRVAIVTGAERDLGQHCSVAFGREGATVVVAHSARDDDTRRAGSAAAAAALIEQAGGRALAVPCDVTDPDSVEDMVRIAREHFGRIDVLVNNADVSASGGMSGISPRHWRNLFDVNLHGVFYCCREVLPTMIGQRAGSIVNVCSKTAEPHGPSAAAIRAVEVLSIGLAQEQAVNGVAVNVLVTAGAIETADLRVGDRRSEAEVDRPPRAGNDTEAAVRLALQTPQSCTGHVLDHVEVLARLDRAPPA